MGGEGELPPGETVTLTFSSYEQGDSIVAESLAEYYDLGIDIFLIRGFDPLIDAIEYGRELIPLTRKLVAERARTRGLAAE